MNRPTSMPARSMVVVALGFLLPLPGGGRGPADSASAEYATAEARAEWIEDAIRGGAPSEVLDAHFVDVEQKVKSGHMGPDYSMWWFHARIEIDTADAPQWAARTTPVPNPPHWQADRNPMKDTPSCAMPPAEFAGARWYDPVPLFSRSAHGGYVTGYLAINEPGDAIYVWQHWR